MSNITSPNGWSFFYNEGKEEDINEKNNIYFIIVHDLIWISFQV